MSEENVEAARRIVSMWEQGDFGAGVADLAPDIAFEVWMPDAGENVTINGLGELRAFMRDWFEQWRNYRLIDAEFTAVGSDKVFVALRQTATGRRSGVEVDSPGFCVFTFLDGKVTRLFVHYDREQALKAAGLSE
jgi:ketosteroid isomerase-like protein